MDQHRSRIEAVQRPKFPPAPKIHTNRRGMCFITPDSHLLFRLVYNDPEHQRPTPCMPFSVLYIRRWFGFQYSPMCNTLEKAADFCVKLTLLGDYMHWAVRLAKAFYTTHICAHKHQLALTKLTIGRESLFLWNGPFLARWRKPEDRTPPGFIRLFLAPLLE